MNKKKTALFCIELAARELVPKCLLALESAKLGMRVYFGPFRALKRLDGAIDGCIFFHKSARKKDADLRKKIGAQFVFLDEEMGLALPRADTISYLKARYSDVSAEKYSHIFAIGELHKSYMNSFKNFDGVNTYPLGWPRIDLWRKPFHVLHEKEVKCIQRNEGDFFLLVSSFGAISESTYQESIKSQRRFYSDDIRVIDFKYKEFRSCKNLIQELSPRLKKGEKIIVRPHTSESLDEWKSILASYPNVNIRNEGDVTPWLLASKGTIQFGSTVAVQAAYMGIPSIQLETERDIPGVTDTPAYEVLNTAKSADEILNFLRNCEDQSPELRQKLVIEGIGNLVASLDGPLASTKIAKVLSEIEISPQAPIRLSWPRRLNLLLREKLNYVQYLKRSKILKQTSRQIQRSRSEKIPNGLTAREISQTLKTLATIQGDDPSRIRCRQVAHNLVEVEFL